MTPTTVQTVANNFTERQQSGAHDHGRWMENSSSSEYSTTALSHFDRRALEQTENLKVLSVQVESARHELQKKRRNG